MHFPFHFHKARQSKNHFYLSPSANKQKTPYQISQLFSLSFIIPILKKPLLNTTQKIYYSLNDIDQSVLCSLMSSFKHVSMFFFLFLVFNCFSMLGSNAKVLPQDEGTFHFIFLVSILFWKLEQSLLISNFRNCSVLFFGSELWKLKPTLNFTVKPTLRSSVFSCNLYQVSSCFHFQNFVHDCCN